ncbi:hypothetical protein [Halobacillus naozhouensis]|uniref:DUF340 domain-containing protein n=1 Tax=Halobacillus naozhouensis TaxID=554880 RepID=A0ABY8IUV7_9BACI|nr:hypothetical protein [Halobacillus naozhouensis]WFT73919.1 hypothetical protein P9989_16315 [Halobacillus naozhouensis]
MMKSMQEWIVLLVIFGIVSLLGNWVGYGTFPVGAIPGMVILILVSLVGMIMQKLIPIDIPSIAYVAIVGVLISMPWMPGSEQIVAMTSSINLLALTTPILAYAGIAIGRSWTDFVKLGWRTIVVASFVMIGTFLGSAIIAEVVLRMQGII